MTVELTQDRDGAARCATALGRIITRGSIDGEEARSGEVERLWINRPGQNRLETAVLAGLFFMTVTGWCFSGLTIWWGWLPALLLSVPAAFLACHAIGLGCAAVTVIVRAMGLRYRGTDSDLTGAISLMVLTGICAAAVISGMFLWPLWALPWLIAAGLNASAWLASCLVSLYRSL